MHKLVAIPLVLSILTGLAQAQTMDSPKMDHSKMDHASHMAMTADGPRQAEVARRGKDVMPFSLAATQHIFTKDAVGGIQRVVARDPSDIAQVNLVRKHLQEIREQFLKGDFSGPKHIHGEDMPGLADLKKAKPGQVDIGYREVTGGAELAYKTSVPNLVVALHKWFDAQLSDHGKDAMAGHAHHDGMIKH